MTNFPQYKHAQVADLIPYARNSRTHSDAQIDKIAASIKEFGFLNPVIVDGENGIIAGHGRIMAAKKLGMETVPVVEADHLTDAQRRAYVIADNRLAEVGAGWDDELLRVEFAELEDLGFDLELTGFEPEEIAALDPEELPAEGLTDDDAVPEEPEEPVTVEGDVWILGNHRLMCGSSDNESCVQAAAPKGYEVVVLDPPYEMRESQWVSWIHDPCVLFGQAKHLRAVPPDLWRFERVIVKRGRHRSATVQVGHMHAFVAQVGSVKTLPGSAETFPSVIEQDTDLHHPHQKSVDLIVEHLSQWVSDWDTVMDPYGGSGSTIVAAEKMGRSCACIEIEPKYCDVIIKRWQEFTGQQAVHEESGKTYQELANAKTAA